MPDFDPCAFAERAAILEYDGGMTRFRAETLAAEAEGTTRWEALRHEADSIGNPARGGDQRSVAAGQPADNMPAVQRGPEEENRPVPERGVSAGRSGVELLALRLEGGPKL